ncbi:MAG: CYTH domain-containing protein [Cyanobacteria bacterium REEB459]|nr:CYTH domain-containing protein [Cyanobacteria bacterium REEB459]
MAIEIERKFLVKDDSWRSGTPGLLLRQGYLPTRNQVTVRVRVVGHQAYLTLKGPAQGLARPEFEYPIPLEDGVILLETLCQLPLIEKYRYRLPLGPVVWEVDEFLGANQGLVLAEVELTTADQRIELPGWVGDEVTADPRYLNANLVHHPFSLW